MLHLRFDFYSVCFEVLEELVNAGPYIRTAGEAAPFCLTMPTRR